jgi:hypothetical protein
MKLAVTIEGDVTVTLELRSKGLPERLAVGYACNDVAIISAEVLCINDCMGTFTGDMIHNATQAEMVGYRYGAGHELGIMRSLRIGIWKMLEP